MKLRNYLDGLTAHEKRDFCSAVGIKDSYLTHIKNGHSIPGVKLAMRIERHTGGEVTLLEMRPDIYGSSSEVAAAE